MAVVEGTLALLLHAFAALGHLVEGMRFHQRALELATRIAHPYEQGRALAFLAERLVTADPVAARRHWQRASAIFERIEVPERFEVARRLHAPEARVA